VIPPPDCGCPASRPPTGISGRIVGTLDKCPIGLGKPSRDHLEILYAHVPRLIVDRMLKDRDA
jgi:hypothetical protein